MELLAKDTHKFESRYLDGLVGPYHEVGARESPAVQLIGDACPVGVGWAGLG